jgi:hypothetical protein
MLHTVVRRLVSLMGVKSTLRILSQTVSGQLLHQVDLHFVDEAAAQDVLSLANGMSTTFGKWTF